jgi:hypothetical protein
VNFLEYSIDQTLEENQIPHTLVKISKMMKVSWITALKKNLK